MDILGASDYGGTYAWWKNDGYQGFEMHLIDDTVGIGWWVHAADVDSDGDIDVLGTDTRGSAILWWENDGEENFTKQTIDDSVGEAFCILGVDIDRDGDTDVLAPSYTYDELAWWENPTAEPELPAVIDIKPDTLNLKSNGKWITAYIELPESYDVADIDVSSVLLEGTIPARPRPVKVGDHDGDGIPDLKVKFDRQALIEYLDGTTGEVMLIVTGELDEGTPFEGGDTIKVIRPGKK
jgi:hypothetical protein